MYFFFFLQGFFPGSDPSSSAPSPSSYVTLPRQRPLMPKGSGQHVDWETLQMKAKATTTLTTAQNSQGSKGKSSLPVYDGVGPR